MSVKMCAFNNSDEFQLFRVTDSEIPNRLTDFKKQTKNTCKFNWRRLK